jgi:hypothetical protein
MPGPHDIEWDEEELPEPARRPNGRLRWSLAGGAVVLAAAGVVARAGSGHHGAAPATPTPTPSPSFSDVVSASAGPVPSPVPDFGRPSCPPGASCAVVRTIPNGVPMAFAKYFPQARVAQVSSVLAERPGRFGPDLVQRAIVAYDGKRTMTITIRKPRASDTDARDASQSGGATVSHVVQVGEAFTLSADVREPVDEEAIFLNTLGALLADPRLVAPQ